MKQELSVQVNGTKVMQPKTYRAFVAALNRCHDFDEVQRIKDVAKQAELYASQARNLTAERMAAEIRIRAQRQTGIILKAMAENGMRASRESPKARGKHVATGGMLPKPTLKDMGMTRQQASEAMALASVPQREFDEAMKAPDKRKPSAKSVAQLVRGEQTKFPPHSLHAWGIVRDLGNDPILKIDPVTLVAPMPDFMKRDIIRLASAIRAWLVQLEGACK